MWELSCARGSAQGAAPGPATFETSASAQACSTPAPAREPLQILHNLSPQAYGEVLEPLRMSWSPGSAPHPSGPHAAGHCWLYLGLGAVARDQESWDCLFPNCGGNPKPFGGWALHAMSPGLCLSARLIAKAVLPCKHSSCPSWVHLALAMS